MGIWESLLPDIFKKWEFKEKWKSSLQENSNSHCLIWKIQKKIVAGKPKFPLFQKWPFQKTIGDKKGRDCGTWVGNLEGEVGIRSLKYKKEIS
jgi:hypothetical protein